MTPMTSTVQMMLNGLNDRWMALVAATPEDALNWQPPADGDTSSVAQLVRHTMTVQDFLLMRALGEAESYDFAHSFRNDPATAEELTGLLRESNARKDELLARLDAMDMSETFTNRAGRHVARAWYVIHTADHGAEHIGHGELTAQLWRAQNA